ncbi:MAG: outer membrane lipoprotein carrier protein LolA [Thermodesulfobacteriota bacterium]
MKNNIPLPLIQFFSLFLLIALPLPASAEDVKDIASRLQQRYDSIQSLSFDFVQDTRGQLSGRPKKGSGQAFFLKERDRQEGETKKIASGKMRWNYLAPERQVLLSDGKTFSMYFESLAQMIITPAETLEQDLTYSFFTGSGNLLQDFNILAPDKTTDNSQDGSIPIKLVPTARQSQVAAIHLWVTDDSLIRRMEILDHFDTLTVLNFTNLKVDNLDKKDVAQMKGLFTFTPPEGTEIIHQ